MASKPGHVAQVAGNAALVQQVLDLLGERGLPALPQVAADAIRLVQRWLGGEVIPRALMSEAARATHDSSAALRNTATLETRALSWACTGIGNLCWMACRERGWPDANRTILDAVRYASLALDPDPVARRADELSMRAALAALQQRAAADAQAASPKTLRVRLVGSRLAPRAEPPGPRCGTGVRCALRWDRHGRCARARRHGLDLGRVRLPHQRRRHRSNPGSRPHCGLAQRQRLFPRRARRRVGSCSRSSSSAATPVRSATSPASMASASPAS